MNNFNYFATSSLKSLKNFCEEYISSAERIIMMDPDAIEIIDKTEEQVRMQRYLEPGSGQFSKMTDRQVKAYFIRLRLEVMQENMIRFPVLKNDLEKINRLVYRSVYEVKELRLVFKDKKNISLTEMYCNYIFIVDYLANIELALNSKKNK